MVEAVQARCTENPVLVINSGSSSLKFAFIDSSSLQVRICEGLGFLGVELNQSCNASDAKVISSDISRVMVRVIRTDEELMIARAVSRVLELTQSRSACG